MTYDCAVIGAGLSGLASSILLAKNGLKTVLIEKSSNTAPLVRGFRRNGHYFDTGFHHAGGIGKGSPVRVMLDYMGVLPLLNLDSSKDNMFDVVKFEDSSFEFKFPSGYEEIKQRLKGAFPEESHFIEEYLDEIKRQCSLLPFLDPDADNNAMNILKNIHGTSLADFLSNHTCNSYLKSVLSVHCLLNGIPPCEQGLINYAYIAGPYYESVNLIDGGGLTLVSAYEKSASENGVDILLNMEAKKLLFSSSGDLTGIGLKDGTQIISRNIISTIHPIALLSLVPETLFRPSYIKRIRTLEETHSAFILYGISEIDLLKMTGRTLYLVPDNGFDLGDFSKPIEKRPLNIMITEADKNENNTQSRFIMICPASFSEVEQWGNSTRETRPHEYLEFKKKACMRMLDIFISCYPDLKGRVHALDFSTPLTLRDYSGSPFGSMYGAKHRIEQYNPLPVTNVNGLYLAGQSVVAPGLLGTLISAFMACANIVGHDLLRGALRGWNQEE